jgi:hypothetical protein
MSLSKYKKDSIVIDEGIYSVGFYFLATILLCIISGFYFNEKYLFIVPPVLLIVLMFTTREVIEIDFANKRYRDGYKFLGKIYRDWKPIPKFKYVSVVGSSMVSSGGRTGGFVLSMFLPISGDTVYDTYDIRLFNTISQRLTIIQFGKYDKAIELAKTIAVSLDGKLLDATVKPAKFIIE